MNESFILYNNSYFEECFTEMYTNLVEALVSLVRMDQSRPENNQHNKRMTYEVTFIPVVITLLIVEQLIRLIQRKDLSRFQDFIINMGASLTFVLLRSLVITVIVFTIYWIYDNWRVIDLSINSIWTWIWALLCGELSLYCTHRAMHEINFLWAVHHFHHMSEDLNFSATLRATIFDLILYDIFAIPMAFFFPPELAVFHIQLGFLYQIWLHNEVVGDLGFIEYIVNTPRQHRVHHGKNRYCIDKNYGTFLMIWDRLFGTYQNYKDDVSIGLVSGTPQTYDSFTLHFGHFKHMLDTILELKGFKNKFWVILKGPGWAPGKPRLGIVEEVPETYNTPKYGYDPRVPYWKKFYALIHISIILLAFMELANDPIIIYTSFKGSVAVLYIMFFLTSIGTLFDNQQFGPYVEIMRSILYFAFEYPLIGQIGWYISRDRLAFTTSLYFIRMTHIFSIIFWIIYVIIKTKYKSKQTIREQNSEDVQQYKSDEKQSNQRVEQILFVVAIICLIFSFLMAFALNMKSCGNIFYQILIGKN